MNSQLGEQSGDELSGDEQSTKF